MSSSRRKVFRSATSRLQKTVLPSLSAKHWDHILVEHLDFLYHHGFPKHDGSVVISAVAWADPSLPRPLKAAFPAASSALRGWDRLEPGLMRAPLPFIVVCRLILVMFQRNATEAGFVTLLLFETYAQVSELFSLSPSQIIAPVPLATGAASHVCMVICTAEHQVPTKTKRVSSTAASR